MNLPLISLLPVLSFFFLSPSSRSFVVILHGYVDLHLFTGLQQLNAISAILIFFLTQFDTRWETIWLLPFPLHWNVSYHHA